MRRTGSPSPPSRLGLASTLIVGIFPQVLEAAPCQQPTSHARTPLFLRAAVRGVRVAAAEQVLPSHAYDDDEERKRDDERRRIIEHVLLETSPQILKTDGMLRKQRRRDDGTASMETSIGAVTQTAGLNSTARVP